MNNLSKTLVLCSALMLTACAEDDPQKFIEEGKALFAKGEMKSAKVQFKNALQINPKLEDAYYGLALIEEEKPDWNAVRGYVKDVLVLNPNHVDAHVKLGFLLLSQIDKAKEQAGIVLKLDPENVGGILLNARVNFLEENNAEAMRLVDLVLVKDKLNSDAIWLQASILLSDKRYDETLVSLNRGLETYPDNKGLGLLKVKLHKELKNYDEVISDYKDIVARNPEDKALRYAQIEVMARFGKPEQLEKLLQDTIARDPADIDLKLSFIDYLEKHDDAVMAEAILKEYVAASPEELRFKSRLSDFYIVRKRYSEAEQELRAIEAADATGKEGLASKVRLAELAWLQGDKVTAESLVEEVIKVDSSNSDGLLFRASIRLDKKDADGAISDLRIVLRDQPNSDQALVMMARANILKSEPEVAESNWRKAIEVNPDNLDAIIPLTSVLIKRGDSAQADALLSKASKASSGNPVLLELLVKLRVSKKDWAGAERAVNDLKQLPQGLVAAQMLAGMLAEKQERYLEAIQVYKDVLSKEPSFADAFKALARVNRSLGQRTEFILFLHDFIKEHPDNIIAYNMLGKTYALDKKWDEASKALAEGLKVKPKSIATYGLLGAVLMQQGKVKEAGELYRNGLLVLPGNRHLMMALARYYQRTNNFNEAVVTYENLINKFPDNDEVVNNFADLLVSPNVISFGLEKALTLVERFKTSSNPYFLDTYGWVLFKSGDFEGAVDALKRVVVATPSVAVFRYHLGEAYYAANNNDASKIELEEALSLAKNSTRFSWVDRSRKLLKKMGVVVNS